MRGHILCITTRVNDKLNLRTISRQNIIVKTFGSVTEQAQTVDDFQLNVKTPEGENILITLYAVELICEPLQCQFIAQAVANNPRLLGLTLVDYSANETDGVVVDILIGVDQYWNFVTGNIVKGVRGPTAIHTKLGWVLSGPVQGTVTEQRQSSNLVVTHSLKCASQPVYNLNESLDENLKKFWELESIGIKSPSLYEEVKNSITFENNRYKVGLPWKSSHPLLPDNYNLCKKRLDNLLQRLQQEPEKLKQYDSVMKE